MAPEQTPKMDARSLLETYLSIWSTGETERLDEILAPGFTEHYPLPVEGDAEGQKKLIQAFRTGFPDLRLEDHGIVTAPDGGSGALYAEFSGTHDGRFLGVPPTKRKVTFVMVLLGRVNDGRLSETWQVPNMMNLMVELGQAEPLRA